MDFFKLGELIRKSFIWIILIFVTTITSSYLYIRYTKEVFESESELKLDVKSEATELGVLGISENQNLNIISSEIELLKSKLFTNKVINTVDLDVSYYIVGKVLNDEKYHASPIKVDYKLNNSRLFDKEIYIEAQDQNSFKISFSDQENLSSTVYKFGQPIITNDIELIVTTTPYFAPEVENKFLFTINSRQALMDYFENNLTVEPRNLSANIIRIALRDHNKYKAHDLVNAIDTIYLNYTQEEKSKENNQKIAWLNKELEQIENQLEGYEDYFENFTIKNRTSDLDEDLKKTITMINQLDSQRFEISQKLLAVEELNESLEKNPPGEIIETSGYKFPAGIKETLGNLAGLIKERDELKLSYSEATFALTKKEDEINKLQNRLKGQLESLKDQYQNEMRDLLIRKKKLEENFVELPGKSTEFKKNQRFFELYEEFYLSLMESKAQFQIAQAGTTTEFKILSPATLPASPIFPNKLIIYGIGIVGGLVVSFIFVGLRYLLHNKISTLSELENLSQAPILGTVPKSSEKMDVTRLIINKNPKSAVSEALRSIRTNIQFMIPGDEHKVISVTSTIGGEGKTFVSINLGGIIALSKKKVIILDLDMRKPRVHLAFGHKKSDKGMSTILINKHKIEDCIISTEIENLDYINAGPTPPNPSELLLNGEFSKLLETLKEKYDLIILDTPPVGLVTDGVLTMNKADLSIYIVRADYSKKLFLQTLNRLISVNQFKNLAVVLNASSTSGSNSYGYGYYEEKKEKNVIKRLVNRGA